MLSYRKTYFLFLILFCSASCGFKPIAKYHHSNIDSDLFALSFVEQELDMEERRNYDYFRKKIKQFYPASLDAKYLIKLANFNYRNVGVNIDSEGNFSTYKLYLAVAYEIINIETGEVLDQDKVELNTNYDISNSIYQTKIVEKEIITNLTNILIERLNDYFLLSISCNYQALRLKKV